MDQVLVMMGKSWDDTPPYLYSNKYINCFVYIYNNMIIHTWVLFRYNNMIVHTWVPIKNMVKMAKNIIFRLIHLII